MARAADVRRIALSLAGTAEAPHFDRTAFKVARIYATLAPDGKTLSVKLTPDEQELKCHVAPDMFSPVPNAWVGRAGRRCSWHGRAKTTCGPHSKWRGVMPDRVSASPRMAEDWNADC